MRRALAALMAFSLCLPAIAQAQRSEREHRDQQSAPQASGPQAQRPQQNGPQAGPQAGGPQAQRPPQNEQRRGDGVFFGRAAPNQAAPSPNTRAPEVAQDRDRRDFDRRDERRDPRDAGRDRRDLDRGRDFRGDRDRGDARRFFTFRGREYSAVRGPEFRYPRGWAYRRWYRGDVLPRLFLADAFFFDYAFLGLPSPPRYYRWVRYGPDALLVNVYDGRVLDVIYDAFY